MSKRPRSPAWSIHGAAQMAMPVTRSEFEEFLRELHLSIEEAKNNPVVRDWVRNNKDRRFIPLEILKVYGYHSYWD